MAVKNNWDFLSEQEKHIAVSLIKYLRTVSRVPPRDKEDLAPVSEAIFQDCDTELIDFLIGAWGARNHNKHAKLDWGPLVCPDWELALVPMAPVQKVSRSDDWRGVVHDCVKTLIEGLCHVSVLKWDARDRHFRLKEIETGVRPKDILRLTLEKLGQPFAGDLQNGWPLLVMSIEIEQGDHDWAREKIEELDSPHVVVLLVEGAITKVFHRRTSA